MGMDVYGLEPKITGEHPEMPDFSDLSKEERQEYFNAVEKFERSNPGYYFRSNIWWWRALCMYVCDLCEDVLSQEDIDGGHVNEGYEITKDKAAVMEERMAGAIEINAHHMYERDYMAALDELPKDDIRSSYPFAAEVVEDFYQFVKHSGGFKIC